MPRKQRDNSYENLLTEVVADDIIGTADRLAAEQGPPPDMESPSERKKLAVWGRKDPAVDRTSLLTALLTTGVPVEQMGTMQIRGLAETHPELVAAYGQPVPEGQEQLAEVLADLAEYPFRVTLYDHLDPKERVAEAKRLQRAWEKEQAGRLHDVDERGRDADGTTGL